jgi:allophanate hydrolase subunit 2
VLGSAATCLVGGFGGHEGRALRHGDVLVGAGHALAHEPDPTGDERWPGAAPPHDGPATLRILPGADGVGLDPGRADAARRVLVATTWTVSPASDRMGLRLDGPADRRSTVEPTVLASHGVVWGAIQLPPDGRPIVLLADHQPTGGYPVVAVVISADRSVLGQLRPGDGVRFVETSVGPAVEALRQRVHDFERAAASVREGAGWDALWRGAGG